MANGSVAVAAKVVAILAVAALLCAPAAAELPRLEHPAKDDGTLSLLVIGDWGRKGTYNQSRVAEQVTARSFCHPDLVDRICNSDSPFIAVVQEHVVRKAVPGTVSFPIGQGDEEYPPAVGRLDASCHFRFVSPRTRKEKEEK